MSASAFLDRIMAAKRAEMQRVSASEREAVRRAALATSATRTPHALRDALIRDGINIIAEVKRSSPSAGAIRAEADAVKTATLYERAGAAAISVLTEPEFFGGSLDDLRQARNNVSVPLLRKDFTVDAHQIYEVAVAGANAVLLIVAGLSPIELRDLRTLAEDELGLDALVEAHDAREIEAALECGATIIGVNNRNLQTLEVTLDTSRKLAGYIGASQVFVSESGIRTPADVAELAALGYRAFLVGEALMRAGDPESTLREFIGTRSTKSRTEAAR